MKTSARFWIILLTVGLLSSVVLPGVSAKIFDIGTKVSESDLDLRDRKLVYFDSGTTVYVEDDYIDYIASIFDGDESTGINHNFGSGHEVMQIELIFPSAVYVSSIVIKPTFGGSSSHYSLEIDTALVFGPWFAYNITTQESFQINCRIPGIILVLYSLGTNHFYFNDVIINYTPNGTSGDLGDGIEHEDEDDLEIDDLFLEPPFTGFLWILVIIALISSMRRRKSKRTKKSYETQESDDDHNTYSETHEPSSSEEQTGVKGRFCPNCNKYTEEEGPFCPFCKRSMV
jgi:hypothetical protein